jgi:hypothetical protein
MEVKILYKNESVKSSLLKDIFSSITLIICMWISYKIFNNQLVFQILLAIGFIACLCSGLSNFWEENKIYCSKKQWRDIKKAIEKYERIKQEG